MLCNIFKKYFAVFGGLDPKSRGFFVYQNTAVNKRPIMMSLLFCTFLKMCIKKIKNNELVKEQITLYCHVIKIIIVTATLTYTPLLGNCLLNKKPPDH